jgi:cytochrome P450
LLGPVVRILPNEVHLADTANWDKIYYVGSKYTKARTYYGALMVPHSTFGAETNGIHKIKRARLNPMFSRRQVLELEDVVQQTVAKVVRLTRAAEAAARPVDLHHMFRGVSVDVISEYAFNQSYALLDSPDLGANFFAMVRGIGPAMWFFQQFPPLKDVALTIPLSVMESYMGPAMRQVAMLQREAMARLQGVRGSMAAGKLPTGRPTIFSELVDPEKQSGYPVPPLDELKDEVYAVLAAAADTTGNAMTVAAYKVLCNPHIYQTLREELLEAFPDPDARLEFTKLEKLPYLTGVIKEGLRYTGPHPLNPR